ncbi:MAG: hypothetical protein ACLU3I_07750 [Acutalibacteraceae bacterium]
MSASTTARPASRPAIPPPPDTRSVGLCRARGHGAGRGRAALQNVGRPVRIGQSAAQLRLFRLRPSLTPQPEGGIPPVPVVLGRQDSITPVPERSEPLLLEKALASRCRLAVTVDESVQVPVEAGQRLGTMTATAGERLLAEIPLVAPEAVPARTFPELWAEF